MDCAFSMSRHGHSESTHYKHVHTYAGDFLANTRLCAPTCIQMQCRRHYLRGRVQNGDPGRKYNNKERGENIFFYI